MENNITYIKNNLSKLLPRLREKYSVKTLGIFGSHIHQVQKPDSDLDLLVTFYKPPGLLTFIELENYLSDLLGLKVDLVMKNALKPKIGQNILKEVVEI